ncbi:hypothetical protein ACJZ2D_005409 [Fusarium nematophilum]
MVWSNNGRPLDEEPVSSLRTASTYGPTVFPIVFAAVAANLLKALAAWKLERGISVLSLEYLLCSKTVQQRPHADDGYRATEPIERDRSPLELPLLARQLGHQRDVQPDHVSPLSLRPLSLPDNLMTVLAVLDGRDLTGGAHRGNAGTEQGFFVSLVKATLTPWTADWKVHIDTSPLEYYVINPESLYSAATFGNDASGHNNKAEIWSIGDEKFSQRMTQLLNTPWIVSIAPYAAMGDAQFRNDTFLGNTRPYAANATGRRTPGVVVLKTEALWLGCCLQRLRPCCLPLWLPRPWGGCGGDRTCWTTRRR